MLPQTFEEAFTQIKQLVVQFQQNEQHYLSPSYNESQARNDFINKFFIALGWDVRHETQQNPYERDVRVELNVKIEGRGKKADYAFYQSNFRDVAFFVEAKKPSRNLANAQDYFQTVRYGWHANTSLAVLTDFEELHIIGCRYKPNIETALNQLIKKRRFNS